MYRIWGRLLVVMTLLSAGTASGEEFGKEGFADSDGVKIHYVTMGEGPLVVMIHGFPDFWYTWRKQMPALAHDYQVVAIDQRGYNKSGQPEGVEQYATGKLVGDVRAVIRHFHREKAVLVGHDWGGMVAWAFAMAHPEMTEALVILNLPHPKGLMRELRNNETQRKNSEYARKFQEPDAAASVTPELLAAWVTDSPAREKYIAAFERSSIEGMLNFYKANYPRAPYDDSKQKYPKIQCPVLMFHGLDDWALLPGALNETWQWVEKDLTLVTVPGAGHFIQQDRPEIVTQRMSSWLADVVPTNVKKPQKAEIKKKSD